MFPMHNDENMEPMYVISIHGYIHLVDMRSVHREGEWIVVADADADVAADAADISDRTTTAASTNANTNTSTSEENVNIHYKNTKVSIDDQKSPLNHNDDHQQQQLQTVQEEVLKISRECIQCDAKDCTTRNPMYRCSSCQSVYYCSKACQRKHWKVHKHDCVPAEEMRASFAPLEECMPENTIRPLEKGTVECGICLQDPSQANPVILPTCQHVFCFLCIEKWKIHQNTMCMEQIVCCPYCRAEIPEDMQVGGLDDDLCDRVLELATRAERREQGSEERRAMCEEGLNIVNQLIERDQDCVRFLFAKAKILVVEGGHTAEVADIVSNIIDLDTEKREKLKKIKEANAFDLTTKVFEQGSFPCLREMALKERMEIIDDIKGMLPNKIDVSLILATALEQDKNWEAALEVYLDLYHKVLNQHTCIAIKCPIMIGMSRCFYEMKMYRDSIEIGMDVITNVFRTYAGARKYPALSLKASTGDLDAAIDLMNQAVLYEAPWDDKNKLEALNLYKELRALKANSMLKSDEKSKDGKESTSALKTNAMKSEKKSKDGMESMTDKLFRQTMFLEAIERGNYDEVYNDDEDDDEDCYDSDG
jgi:hypothetical protein